MAASIMKCGEHRVWMDPDRLDEIAQAVTKDDIRVLVRGKAIISRQRQGISRGRKKYAMNQKQKGRRRGQGSRKGGSNARFPRKRRWISTIRPLRAYLRQLRDDGKINASTYRKYYMKAKGGEFRSKRHLHTHLLSDGVIKQQEART